MHTAGQRLRSFAAIDTFDICVYVELEAAGRFVFAIERQIILGRRNLIMEEGVVHR